MKNTLLLLFTFLTVGFTTTRSYSQSYLKIVNQSNYDITVFTQYIDIDGCVLDAVVESGNIEPGQFFEPGLSGIAPLYPYMIRVYTTDCIETYDVTTLPPCELYSPSSLNTCSSDVPAGYVSGELLIFSGCSEEDDIVDDPLGLKVVWKAGEVISPDYDEYNLVRIYN